MPLGDHCGRGDGGLGKVEREGGREGGEFFVCFLFLFLGRRASAFCKLGKRQGEQVVRWVTRVGK